MKKIPFHSVGDLAIRPESVGLVWPQSPASYEMTDSGIFVLNIVGPLEHHASFWFCSYEEIVCKIEGAMCDDDVRAIVMRIDSPGGDVNGLNETVKKIRALRAEYGKPICAYADEEAYSAAYALACAADSIYLPDAGGVGSIGVLATLCDRTQQNRDNGLNVAVIRSGNRKAEGHPDIELSDAVIGRVQRRVDDLAKAFFQLVADVRPISKKDIEALQGQTVFGKNAVKIGLANAVQSFDQTIIDLENLLDNPSEPNQTRNTLMPPISALQKKVTAAIAAVESARSPEARKKAAVALARAQALLTEAKVKKSYKKRTVEEEAEEDDGEADEGEDAEDSDDSEDAAAPPPDDDDDDGDGDEDSEEDDEDEEKAKKMKKSKKAAASSISSYVKSMTGQSSAASAVQVLEAMHESAQRTKRLEDEVASLKSKASKAELDKLVSEGVSAGKIKPAQLAWAKTQSKASLKAFLDSTPAIFVARQPSVGDEEQVQASGADGLTDFEREIAKEQGVTPEAFKAAKTNKAGRPRIN